MKALDVLGLDYVADKIYDLINSGGSADYIVEERQDGPWYYRKWASGISECWAIEYSLGSCAMTSKYGNAWYVAKSGFSFPVDSNGNRIFISNPYLNISCKSDSGLISASVYYCSKDSYNFYLYDMQSETKTVYINVYAKGLWKAFTPSTSKATYPLGDYIIMREFTGDTLSMANNTGYNYMIPYTVPNGYKVLGTGSCRSNGNVVLGYVGGWSDTQISVWCKHWSGSTLSCTFTVQMFFVKDI